MTTVNNGFEFSNDNNGAASFKPAIKSSAMPIGSELICQFVGIKKFPSKFGGDVVYMSVLLLTPDADGKLQMADVDGNLVGSESDAKHDILLNSGAKMAVDYAKLVEGDVFKLRRGDDKLKVGETIYFKVSGDYQDKNGAKMPQLAQEESEVFYKKKVGFVEKTFKVADDTEATKKEIEAFAKANAGKPTARKLPSYVVLKGRRKE